MLTDSYILHIYRFKEFIQSPKLRNSIDKSESGKDLKTQRSPFGSCLPNDLPCHFVLLCFGCEKPEIVETSLIFFTSVTVTVSLTMAETSDWN